MDGAQVDAAKAELRKGLDDLEARVQRSVREAEAILKAAANAGAADAEKSWKQITKLAERERELDPKFS